MISIGEYSPPLIEEIARHTLNAFVLLLLGEQVTGLIHSFLLDGCHTLLSLMKLRTNLSLILE